MFLTELFLGRLNSIAMFLLFNLTIRLKNTGITGFDIIAVLSLTMAILIVGKISNLKVRPEVYCAYCYLVRY